MSTSAVCAAEDVRSAVRAARTAASAKTAAESASASAKKSLDKLLKSSSNKVTDAEIHAAQTRVEISKSHAIHAALVAHETTTVKRKAAVALAHDVCQWSDHRKRELVQTCISAAKSQSQISGKWADAWKVLKEAVNGPIESDGSMLERSAVISTKTSDDSEDSPDSLSGKNTSKLSHHLRFPLDEDILNLGQMPVISGTSTDGCPNFLENECSVVAEAKVEDSTATEKTPETLLGGGRVLHSAIDLDLEPFSLPQSAVSARRNSQDSELNERSSPAFLENFTSDACIFSHDDAKQRDEQGVFEETPSRFSSGLLTLSYDTPNPASHESDNGESNLTPQELKNNATTELNRKQSPPVQINDESSDEGEPQILHGESNEADNTLILGDKNDVMTASMQSLVEGLMAWGCRYDLHDDISLPAGLAVSLALEEGAEDQNL